MNPLSILVGILILVLGIAVVYLNPGIHTVNLAMFEITTSVGIACASAFGLGLLTGAIAMLTRDVPRRRLIRTLDPDS